MSLRHVSLGVPALITAGLLAACGSSQAPSTATGTTAPAAPAAASPSAPPPTFPAQPAVTINATDSDGDKATLTIKVGHLSPVTDVPDPSIHACDSIHENMQTTAAQSIAIPVQLTAAVTSSQPAGLIIDLNADDAVEPPSEAPQPGTVGSPDELPSWVQVYINDPECTGVSTPDAVFKVDSLSPGDSITWLSYLIVPGAVTPDDPGGITQGAGLEMIVPNLTLGEDEADYTVDTAASTNLVNCVDTIGDANMMVSVDPPAAVADGCTR